MYKNRLWKDIYWNDWTFWKKLLPLFEKDKDGKVDFLVISHDSLKYQADEFYQITLPKGFKQVYGEELDDNMKAKACHYGFHPADDNGILTGTFRERALAYQGRKKI